MTDREPQGRRSSRHTRVLGMSLAASLAALLGIAVGCKDPNTSFDIGHCVEPAEVAALGEHAAAAGLRVATINMWGIPVVSRHIGARFEALAERLRSEPVLDVVGLQEVWDSGARSALLDALRTEFPFQVDFHGEHGRSGLAILSRLPFAGEPRFHPYRETGKWWKPWNGEWFGGKGVGAVRISTEAGPLWTAVTHLHSCYAAGAPLACDEDDEFAAHRLSQLRELREFVNDLAGEEPALVLGDFNFTPTSKAFASLGEPRQAGLFDPGWRHVGEPHAPETRIDHIWLRPGRDRSLQKAAPARVVLAAPVHVAPDLVVPLSDHCAIAATVTFAD